MLNLPIKVIDKHITPAGGEAAITFTLGNLVTQWDAREGITSRHLVVIINAAEVGASDYGDITVSFNGDLGNNYGYQRLYGLDNAAASDIHDASDGLDLGRFVAGATLANAFGGGSLFIPHAFNTVNNKAVLALGGSSEHLVGAWSGLWSNIAAITSITLAGGSNFIAGSKFLLCVVDERYVVSEEILGADGTFNVNNIPQGKGDLAVIGYLRSDRAAVWDDINHMINDDAVAANYMRQRLDGAAAVTSASSNPDLIAGIISGNNASANAFGALVGIYSQYTQGNQPYFLTLSGFHETSGPTSQVRVMSGRRNNIEPINKLYLEPNNGTSFKEGSGLWVYRTPKRLIDRQVLTVDTATVTFADIPQYFDDLVLHVYARTDEAAVDDEIAITLNADAVAANYDWQELQGAAAAVAALRSAASQQLMYVPGDNEGAGEFGGGSALFPAYARTDGHKHIILLDGQQENRVAISSHRWESLTAITTIALDPVTGNNFLAGSVFELEGILRKEGLPANAGMSISA